MLIRKLLIAGAALTMVSAFAGPEIATSTPPNAGQMFDAAADASENYVPCSIPNGPYTKGYTGPKNVSFSSPFGGSVGAVADDVLAELCAYGDMPVMVEAAQ